MFRFFMAVLGLLAVACSDAPAPNWPDGSGLAPEIMGPGVAIADLDSDGLPDGRFEASPGPAPWSGPFWSSSAAFCDFDGDGDLDLYVAHFLDYDPGQACFAPNGAVDAEALLVRGEGRPL